MYSREGVTGCLKSRTKSIFINPEQTPVVTPARGWNVRESVSGKAVCDGLQG